MTPQRVDLTTFLRSEPPVEEAAGRILEEFILTRKPSESIGNFASTYTGLPPGEINSSVARIVFEAFQWLQAHGMLAPTSQAGWCFVTRLGQEVKDEGGLKAYLTDKNSGADAAVKSIQNDLAQMKRRAEAEISAAVEDAKKEAGTILNLARKTAEGVSLKDVQMQFEKAGTECLKRLRIWTVLSCAGMTALVGLLIAFMTGWGPSWQSPVNAPLGGASLAPAIYQSVIRVTLLTVIGAVTTLCLKVMRAQMHLREQNLHRERVANSVAAFLAAASSPEQRDLILGRMVDAVTVFGNSGLLSDNDESMSPAKLILESLPRSLPKT
jgi:hypothetical protein